MTIVAQGLPSRRKNTSGCTQGKYVGLQRACSGPWQLANEFYQCICIPAALLDTL